ncbi:putative serine carboxypeptidase-like 23 [Olea europaea var. sylvestris]|uniref:putative serine carboxypeptidase-like 23 n=1 Tax=Olea europaea var. sylvestris TaxID=158386 RepID=UPI000C1CDBF2|nr:putative serine carboxypeptidase-like 23 [Olea europaea var. sylvestris]
MVELDPFRVNNTEELYFKMITHGLMNPLLGLDSLIQTRPLITIALVIRALPMMPILFSSIGLRGFHNTKPGNSTLLARVMQVGNAFFDDSKMSPGYYNYFWTHALNSDETHKEIISLCDFLSSTASDEFNSSINKVYNQLGNIDITNIYAPRCRNPELKNGSSKVQRALHVKLTSWNLCRQTCKELLCQSLRISWLYSGDINANVPVTVTRVAINNLKLAMENPWHAWYLNNEVGGYVVEYKGLTFVIGPKNHPQWAFTMISSFLQGILPPPNFLNFSGH